MISILTRCLSLTSTYYSIVLWAQDNPLISRMDLSGISGAAAFGFCPRIKFLAPIFPQSSGAAMDIRINKEYISSAFFSQHVSQRNFNYSLTINSHEKWLDFNRIFGWTDDPIPMSCFTVYVRNKDDIEVEVVRLVPRTEHEKNMLKNYLFEVQDKDQMTYWFIEPNLLRNNSTILVEAR